MTQGFENVAARASSTDIPRHRDLLGGARRHALRSARPGRGAAEERVRIYGDLLRPACPRGAGLACRAAGRGEEGGGPPLLRRIGDWAVLSRPQRPRRRRADRDRRGRRGGRRAAATGAHRQSLAELAISRG
ncbi:hypothetical protein AB5I41_13590 [Sphingomonas sp. MMS24-JH45]